MYIRVFMEQFSPLSSSLFSLREDHQIACAVDDIHGNVINVKPPMCFTMDNASDLISALDLVLSQ